MDNSELKKILGGEEESSSQGVDINFKRFLGLVMRYWYVVVLSIVIGLAAAFLYNRYSTTIYPVTASIIIKEGEENAGARFLYDNELLTPYRNFYNEIFILKSYPLMQEVIEELNFQVAYFREGQVKSVEYYKANFPVTIHILDEDHMPWGKTMYFRMKQSSFAFAESPELLEESFYTYNDTVNVGGHLFYVHKENAMDRDLLNEVLTVRFYNPFSLAKLYSSKLEATWAQQGASVVNLDIQGPEPEKEIHFLNTFIEKYQEYDVQRKSQMVKQSLAFLDRQIADMGDSLSYYENRILDFKRENLTSNLSGESFRLYDKLQDLEAQKVRFKLQDNYLDYLVEYMNTDTSVEEEIITPSSVGLDDPTLNKMITDLIEIQSELALLRGSDKVEANPLFQEMVREFEQLQKSIKEGIKNFRRTKQMNIDFINNQISSLETELMQLPGLEQELVNIQREFTLRDNLYNFLLEKRAEAGISKASTTTDIVVVNPPVISGGPVSPKPIQNYAIGGGLGTFLPLIIFLIVEVMNNKIQSKEDLEKATKLPFLGAIGHKNLHHNLVVHDKPRSAVAESFRSIRSNLNYFTEGKDKKIFLVTSSLPAEGKTFTTINLATVLALSGKKTLIVGADMRKPRIYNDFNLTNDIGLSNVLSKISTFEEVVQHTSIDNLDIISGGPIPPNPSELLLSSEVDALLKRSLENYDYIIIDTPPVLLVTDAIVLSKYSDHNIFLVRQGITPKPAIKSSEERFMPEFREKTSIVLNDIRKSGPGYGDDYGYSYSYSHAGYYTN